MIFRIPEEKEFRLVVEGLCDKHTNRTFPFSLEIDFKVLNRYSFDGDYIYSDYSVSFRVINRMKHFIQMSYDHYDYSKKIWQFSYFNIFRSEIKSSDTIYDLFVQINWKEQKDENNKYTFLSAVSIWVEFQDPDGECGIFL